MGAQASLRHANAQTKKLELELKKVKKEAKQQDLKAKKEAKQAKDKRGSSKKAACADQEMKDVDVCKICMDGPVQTVFVPCGHMLACLSCSRSLENKKCPVCRKRVKQAIRTYKA